MPFHRACIVYIIFHSLSNFGELYLIPGARYGEHNLQINVADQNTEVTSSATVRIFYLDDDALNSVASLRLSGIKNL